MADYLLPVGCEDILISTVQTLVDLDPGLAFIYLSDVGMRTFAHAPVYNSATGA
jgi:hypothetical protein